MSRRPPGAPVPAPDPELAPDAWDRVAAWLADHGALPLVGALTIALCVIYAGVFRGELVGDDLTFHMAESARLADCIRAGDWDLWNPSANGGFASAYYYQVLPQLASAIPTAIFGHHLFWFQLSIFVPLVLTPIAAYRGMRLLGAVPWQAALGAAALSFTIGTSRWGFGADGTFSVGLYTQTWAFAALPLALGHAARWATTARGLGAAVAWGAFVGLCHPFAVIALGLALLFAWFAHALLLGTDHGRAWIGGRLARAGRLPWLAARWQRRSSERTASTVGHEFVRLGVFALLLSISLLPILVPLLIDYVGFGGFPHRVKDEVGPGFIELGKWFVHGSILDHGRSLILTIALPIVLVFARPRFARWLWAPAAIYTLLLALGPHLGTTGDDLLPAVRFLGALQVVLALGIGAGLFELGRALWHATEGSTAWYATRYVLLAVVVIGGPVLGFYLGWVAPDRSPLLRFVQLLTLGMVDDLRTLRIIGLIVIVVGVAIAARPVWRALETEFGIRTGISAAIAALAVLIAVPGAQVQRGRVRVLADFAGSHREEMMPIIKTLSQQPPGRKQVGPGCENHWWNLLTYVYARIPATLQMGGGGLQASPNYDYLWTVRDHAKIAWLYDAPYLVFDKAKGATMPVGDVVIETGTYVVRKLPSPGLVSPIQITGVLPAGPSGQSSAVRKAALAWARTKLPLDNHHLAYAGHGLAGGAPQGTVVRAWRQDSPGDLADLVAEVEVTAPTTFVFRESWHPRWRAYLDGREVAIRRVTPDFPAVDSPPGRHVLQLRFERPWWAQVAWLAWPFAAIVGWLVGWWLRRRRERAAA